MVTEHVPAINWLDSLEEAMRQCQETGRPIFLDLFSPT
jgi:hypothetical protein